MGIKKTGGWLLLLAVLSVAQAHAQLLVSPEVAPPHTPIFAELAGPEDPNAQVKTIWSSDLAAEQYVEIAPNRLAVWAPPGDHYFEVLMVTQTFEEIDVFKPDPAAPKDLDKGTWVKVKVAKDLSINKYRETFTVAGLPPGPGPGPAPGPGPTPVPVPGPTPGGLAGQVQAILKAMPAGAYDKAKALEIGDNYLTVGSQGSDPARSGNWQLATFGSETKKLNLATLGPDGVLQWGPTFFLPIAQLQGKISRERNIADNDIKGLAALWTETGEAIKAAAY